MPENPITDRVRELIKGNIPSVLQLEILLYLYAARPRFIAMTESARVLGLDPLALQQQLEDLERRGLVVRQTTPEVAFGYGSRDADRDAAVQELTDAYRSHRVSVINLIYSPATDKLRTFADAFRLRQDEKGDRQ